MAFTLSISACNGRSEGIAAFNKHDFVTALRILEPLANKGDAEAQYLLGKMCAVVTDQAKSIEWFKKSSEQGYAKAQAYLGIWYLKGLNVAQDKVKARELLQKAFSTLKEMAEKGDPESQYILSALYGLDSDSGIDKDVLKAKEWLMKAATQGFVEAQSAVANRYEHGWDNFPKDISKAMELYEKAAIQGDEMAPFNLGMIYQNKIVPKDSINAIKWLEKASAQGNQFASSAQFVLGEIYAKGDGAPKVTIKAVKCFEKAVAL